MKVCLILYSDVENACASCSRSPFLRNYVTYKIQFTKAERERVTREI